MFPDTQISGSTPERSSRLIKKWRIFECNQDKAFCWLLVQTTSVIFLDFDVFVQPIYQRVPFLPILENDTFEY